MILLTGGVLSEVVLTGWALLAWLYLLLAHGRFWQSGPMLQRSPSPCGLGSRSEPRLQAGGSGGDGSGELPSVAIVIPARDEAPVIKATLRSLLGQDYAGPFRLILVDDGSTDGTGAIARGLADPRLTIVEGTPPPSSWSGKLWAVAQGVTEAEDAELILLTDADIVHDPEHLSTLVAQAERHDLDMVSEMAALACDSLAERALVPAFVYFFQLLYPFAWVNDPLRATAAAAGGTILIRRRALRRIGGIAAVRGALIDDVALARAVKRGGRIWLGHTWLARSVRPYPAFADIWRMIARTAYVQLRYSPLLLLGTTVGLALVFLVGPFAAVHAHGLARLLGVAIWAALAGSYLPTLGRFRRSPFWAVLLPAVALFYMAATIGSAVDHYRGRGVRWKQRAYQGVEH